MADKINIIVTEKALTDLNEAIAKVKELEQFINKASSPSANNNYTASLKQQALETKNLTDAIIQEEKIKQAKLQTDIKIHQQIKSTISLKESDRKAGLAQENQAKKEALANEKLLASQKKLNDAYGQLTQRRNESARALQNSIIETGRSSEATRRLQREFDVLNRRVQQADRAVGRFSQTNNVMGNSLRGVTNLMGAFGIATGLYLGASIVKNIYETTKQLQSLDLALKMVSGSQEEFAINQGFLRSLAEQYGIEIKGLTKNFTEFWVASKGKLEAEQIKGIFTSISKSVAVMGLSVQQQDSAFLALQQMMSKGTVQAEELKKQLGNALPGAVKAATMAYQALHPEMKVTEKYFMEQMKAGKVLSSELLPELAKAYEKLYGIENVNRAETLQAAQERLANSWTDMVRSMNEANNAGLARFLNSTMKMLGNFVDFTKLLFKDEKQLQEYFKNIGAGQGLQEYNAIMKNIAGLSKEQMEITKKALIDREKETIRVNLAIVASEKKKRESIIGGDRALFHLQTKMEEDALVKIGKSSAILKSISGSRFSKISEATTPTAKTETETERKAREKAEKDRLKAIEDSLKLDYDLALSNANRKKELIEDELKAFKGSVQQKMQLSMKLALAENEINKIKFKESKRLAKGDTRLVGIAENEEFKAQGDSIQNNLKRIEGYWSDYFKSLDNMPDTIFGDKFKLTPEQEEELKNYNEKIKAELKANRDVFNSFAGDFADKLGFTETFDFLLAEDKNGETLFDRLKADEATWKDYGLAITTIMQDAYNFINQQSQQRFDAEYERLASQKEVAIRYAGDGTAAKEKIELDYAKKKKEIENREAKAKKKQAIFNIAIDTAQAAMSSWAKTGFPWMAAAAIAMGAVQIAMVASQKIPEYWTGTDNAKEGLALTQERGAEIITDRKGKIKTFGSHKGAVLTRMQSGDKVFNAEESKRMMFENEYRLKTTTTNTNNGMTADEMESVMVRTLGGRPTLNMNFDKGGFGSYISKNGNITRQSESRGSGKGIEV